MGRVTFVDADPSDPEAFTYARRDGRVVTRKMVPNLGPRKKLEKFHVIARLHPKHQHIAYEYLEPDQVTIVSTFRKPQGAKKKDQRVRAATERARQSCAQGTDQINAAHEAACWLRNECGWIDKPGKDVERTIYKNLRQNR
jgi:hypothetical protein